MLYAICYIRCAPLFRAVAWLPYTRRPGDLRRLRDPRRFIKMNRWYSPQRFASGVIALIWCEDTMSSSGKIDEQCREALLRLSPKDAMVTRSVRTERTMVLTPLGSFASLSPIFFKDRRYPHSPLGSGVNRL